MHQQPRLQECNRHRTNISKTNNKQQSHPGHAHLTRATTNTDNSGNEKQPQAPAHGHKPTHSTDQNAGSANRKGRNHTRNNPNNNVTAPKPTHPQIIANNRSQPHTHRHTRTHTHTIDAHASARAATAASHVRSMSIECRRPATNHLTAQRPVL